MADHKTHGPHRLGGEPLPPGLTDRKLVQALDIVEDWETGENDFSDSAVALILRLYRLFSIQDDRESKPSFDIGVTG